MVLWEHKCGRNQTKTGTAFTSSDSQRGESVQKTSPNKYAAAIAVGNKVIELEVVTEQLHGIMGYRQVLNVVVLLSGGLLYNFPFVRKLLSVYALGHGRLGFVIVNVG